MDMGMLEMMLGGMGFGGGGGGRKISTHIGFPEELDISPALSEESLAEGQPSRYSLHGVLVHSGSSAHSGHYFSYVRGPAGGWYLCDDSHVASVDIKQVMSQRAYMLFYSRIPQKSGVKYPGPVHVHASAGGGPVSPAVVAASSARPDAISEALRLDPSPAESTAPAKQRLEPEAAAGGEVPGILALAGAVSPSGDDNPELLAAVRRPRAASWTSDDGALGASSGGSNVTADTSKNALAVLATIREEDGIGASPMRAARSASSGSGVAEELQGFGGEVWAGL